MRVRWDVKAIGTPSHQRVVGADLDRAVAILQRGRSGDRLRAFRKRGSNERARSTGLGFLQQTFGKRRERPRGVADERRSGAHATAIGVTAG